MNTDMQEQNYPKVKKIEVKENFHGTTVIDNYRWMEDHREPELVEWVEKQNHLFHNFIDDNSSIKKDLEALFNYTRYGMPIKKNGYYYYSKNMGMEKQSKYYRRSIETTEETLILDPNTLSENATLAVVNMTYSPNGKMVILELSQSGSDWRTLKILYLDDLSFGKDELENIRNGASIQWLNDESGFYYSAFVGKEDHGSSKIWFHKIGSSQFEDQLIYEHPTDDQMNSTLWLDHTQEHQFVYHYKDTMPRNQLYYKSKSQDIFIPIYDEYKFAFSVIEVIDNMAYVLTNQNAPLGKIIQIDLLNPTSNNWKTIVPEKFPIIRYGGVKIIQNKIFVIYNNNVNNEVYVYNLDGSLSHEISFPSYGSIVLSGSFSHSYLFFAFSSFLYPYSIYEYDIQNNLLKIFEKPKLSIDTSNFVVDKIEYESYDGTVIPMHVMHKKNIKKDGSNPTLLYGYGGFNISLNPTFNPFAIYWMNMGGVYAIPNLRGGGEFGEEWHKSGLLFNKQNVFDDFHSAAEYLIKNNYTTSSKLASRGGSNGGLLTAATMLQKPHLYGAVLTLVGVLDMLRYHLYTIGRYWVPEYGDINNKDEFLNMYKYSPLHNVKENVQYPPTYVYTADYDDRVDTAHSKKYAAILQEKGKGGPFLMRVQTNAGHNAIGKQVTKIIEDMSYEISFLKKIFGI